MAKRLSRLCGVITGTVVVTGLVAGTAPALAAGPGENSVLRPGASVEEANGTSYDAARSGRESPLLPQPPDPGSELVRVAGTMPGWARSETQTGQAKPEARRTVQVGFGLRDAAGAERYAREVSRPGSPVFGQHLSPDEFTSRFAASPESVQAATGWLQGQGLQVGEVAPNRQYVTVSGTNVQLERAFHVDLQTFRHRVDGAVQELVAPDRDITLPSTLDGVVQAVVGLDDSARTMRPAHSFRPGTAQPAAPGDGAGCGAFWGQVNPDRVPQKYPAGRQSAPLCGLDGGQLRSAYGVDDPTGNIDGGQGTRIGITGVYHLDSVVEDTNRAAVSHGTPPLRPGAYQAHLPEQFNPDPACEPEAWKGEQALDVQAAHTMAPAAGIDYYGATDCNDVLSALNRAVTDNSVDVITNSWTTATGESSVPEATRDQVNALAVQAATQGQAVLFASGDAGDNSGLAGRPEPSFPASSPWVTAVGGTSTAIGPNREVLFATGWEHAGNTLAGDQWTPQQDSDGAFAGGAGGGASGVYGMPDYQRPVVGETTGGRRGVSDIAANADPLTGMAIGYTSQGEYGDVVAGGTSLASPLVAGLVANAQAQHDGRIGFVNPALYRMAGTPAVTDVTPQAAGIVADAMVQFGGVDVPSGPGPFLLDLDTRPQTLQSGTGWDPVTGVGAPDSGGEFVRGLAGH